MTPQRHMLGVVSEHRSTSPFGAGERELGKRLVAQRAAVDRELGARHVLRLVQREVHDAGGNVGELAEARGHDVPLERGAGSLDARSALVATGIR